MTQVTPPRLLQPGLIPFVPGVERHRARGGGACVIALDEGDGITCTDREGRQRREVTALNPKGGVDLGVLGLEGKERASFLGGENGKAVAAVLQHHGVDGESLKVAVFFGDSALPGDAVTFTAQRDTVCIITAPGGPMAVEHAGIGAYVEIGKLDGHQKRIPATVVRLPFYDPDKTRVRS